MISPILVTGATGTVGSQVLRLLSRQRVAIRAAIHSTARGRFIHNANIEHLVVDYHSPETIAAAMVHVKRMFLLTPLVPEMVDMTRALVTEAVRAGVEHIVKLSMMGAGPQAAIAITRWHSAAERVVEEAGVAWTFLRPNAFMQNFITYHHGSIRAHNAFYLPHGEGRVSFVDARDVAAVAAAVLTQPGHAGKCYHLTGPQALSNTDVAEMLSRVCGRTIRYVEVSEEETRQAMKQAGQPQWMIDAMMELHEENRSGYAASVHPDIAVVTGRAATPFEQFARDHAAIFR